MTKSEQHPQRRPSTDLVFSIKRADLLFWLSWVEMTVLGGIVSLAILYFLTLVPNISLPYPLGPQVDNVAGAVHFLLLASPLFFVSLCQWFLLRCFVAQPGLWLVIGGVCGPISTFVYLMGVFIMNGNSPPSGFYDSEFWFDASILTIVGLIVGGLVGGLQALLIDRTYQAKRGRVLCWICATAIAWGTAFTFGERVMLTLLANTIPETNDSNVTSFPPIFYAFSVGVVCLIIGLITGAALIWLGGNQVQADSNPSEPVAPPLPNRAMIARRPRPYRGFI